MESGVREKILEKIQFIAPLIIFAVGCTALIWVSIPMWCSGYFNDDAFISFTYVKNLLNHKGFVYNHPPVTLGTTTPFLVFLLVIGVTLIHALSIGQVAILVSGISWIVASCLLVSIFQKASGNRFVSFVAVIPVLYATQRWNSIVGMEMLLFQGLLITAVYLCFTKRFFLSGLTVGCLFLTRGEGILLAILLPVFVIGFKQFKSIFRLASGCCVVLLTWFIYAWYTFGYFLPLTLKAKQYQALIPNQPSFFDEMIFHVMPIYLNSFRTLDCSILNPLVILALIGLLGICFKYRRLIIFPIWGVTYFLGYLVLNPGPYFWYIFHVAFVIQVLACIGVLWLLDLAGNSGKNRVTRWFSGVAAVLLITILLAKCFIYYSEEAMNRNLDPKAPFYIAISDWFNEHADPAESIGYLEIGNIGFHTENRIVDFGGIIDPEVGKNNPIHGLGWGFIHRKPDYLIYASDFDWMYSEINQHLGGYHLETEFFFTPNHHFKIYKKM